MKWDAFRNMRNFQRTEDMEDKIINEINNQEEDKMEQSFTNTNSGAKIVIKKCAHCGKDFAVEERYAKRKKYCSKSCVKAVECKKQREYYYNVLKGKRQDNIAQHNVEKATQVLSAAPVETPVAPAPVEQTTPDFFKIATVTLEIMKITNDNTTDANKMARIMGVVEELMKGAK